MRSRAGTTPDPDVPADAAWASLKDLVRMRTVSTSGSWGEMYDAAARIARMFTEAGVPTSLVETDGPPAVVGRSVPRQHRGSRPAVLLYAHYDVVDEGDLDAWTSPPFEPEERDGRLYGRGAADDKAAVAMHLATARAFADDVGVDIVVLIEGGEEIGSPGFADLLAAQSETLACSLVIVADGANWSDEIPAVTTSLRGSLKVTLTIETHDEAIHSGVWGGTEPDALLVAARLITSFHTPSGDVALRGLRKADPPSVAMSEDELRLETSRLPGVRRLGSHGITEQLWSRAAINVIGIDAPRVGGANNIVVPRARVALSIRFPSPNTSALVLGALEDHVNRRIPWGAHWTLETVSAAEPASLDLDPGLRRDLDVALSAAFERPPVFVGEGSTIPVVSVFREMFPGVPVALTGVSSKDSAAHAPNECVSRGAFERSLRAQVGLIARIRGAH